MLSRKKIIRNKKVEMMILGMEWELEKDKHIKELKTLEMKFNLKNKFKEIKINKKMRIKMQKIKNKMI